MTTKQALRFIAKRFRAFHTTGQRRELTKYGICRAASVLLDAEQITPETFVELMILVREARHICLRGFYWYPRDAKHALLRAVWCEVQAELLREKKYAA